MEDEKVDLKAKSVEFIKKNVALSSMIAIGLGLISYGIFEYKKPQESTLEFVSSTEEVRGEVAPGVSEQKISIDIQGEIKNPGVYELEADSRVSDAIKSSGGLSKDADQEYVAKKVNQAQKLVDGQKIYIPRIGEDTSGLVSAQSAGSEVVSSGLVGINSGSKSSLESLPKIGPVTSDKIISGRPYGGLEELVSKKILGQKTYDAIKDLISLE